VKAKIEVLREDFMPIIKATQDTLLKRRPVQSGVLSDAEKLGIKKGEAIACNWIKPQPGGHLLIELSKPRAGFYQWYIFTQHCNFTPVKDTAIKLAIAWDSQTNSRYPTQAYRMCFSSSVWMAASYASILFRRKFAKDDDYLKEVLKCGDTKIADAHLEALSHAGVYAQYKQNGKVADLIYQLEKGLPVAIGILHHGTLKYPTGGGHWVVVGGVSADRRSFLLFDPYGSVTENPPYSGKVEAGNGYWVDVAVLDSRWTVQSTNDGWMMSFEGN
jgi:hypothetical protein